jgi:hypothetical protein
LPLALLPPLLLPLLFPLPFPLSAAFILAAAVEAEASELLATDAALLELLELLLLAATAEWRSVA